MKTAELNNLTRQQLEEKIVEWRHQFFQMRLQRTTEHMPSYASEKRKLKTLIARGMTVRTQMQHAEDLARWAEFFKEMSSVDQSQASYESDSI